MAAKLSLEKYEKNWIRHLRHKARVAFGVWHLELRRNRYNTVVDCHHILYNFLKNFLNNNWSVNWDREMRTTSRCRHEKQTLSSFAFSNSYRNQFFLAQSDWPIGSVRTESGYSFQNLLIKTNWVRQVFVVEFELFYPANSQQHIPFDIQSGLCFIWNSKNKFNRLVGHVLWQTMQPAGSPLHIILQNGPRTNLIYTQWKSIVAITKFEFWQDMIRV